MPVDIDESFCWLIQRYIASLDADRAALGNHGSPTTHHRHTRRGHSSRTGELQ
jgi:hypothetical protein